MPCSVGTCNLSKKKKADTAWNTHILKKKERGDWLCATTTHSVCNCVFSLKMSWSKEVRQLPLMSRYVKEVSASKMPDERWERQ